MTDEYQRIPPQSNDAEACVLGSMLLDSRVVPEVQAILDEADFYRPAHATIYRSLCLAFAKNKILDLVLAKESLTAGGKLDEVGGIEYLVALVDGVPSATNAIYYANIVKDKSNLRKIIRIAAEISADAYDPAVQCGELLANLQQEVYSLASGRYSGRTTTASKAAQAVMDHSEKVQRGEIPPALSLGFHKIDIVTGGGVRPGQLVVIAGATSVGKSALATKFIINAACKAATAKVFSKEMSNEEIAQRMLQILSGVNGLKISNGRLRADEWTRINEAKAKLDEWGGRVELTDKAMTVPEMVTELQRTSMRMGEIDLVVVDYLQIVPSEGRDIRERINNVTRSLKLAAGDLKVPIILLSQLSRAHQQANKPPELYDLKESSNIEQDADGAILLYRPENEEPDVVTGSYIVKAKVAKWRGGMTTTWDGDSAIRLRFYPSATDFREA